MVEINGFFHDTYNENQDTGPKFIPLVAIKVKIQLENGDGWQGILSFFTTDTTDYYILPCNQYDGAVGFFLSFRDLLSLSWVEAHSTLPLYSFQANGIKFRMWTCICKQFNSRILMSL